MHYSFFLFKNVSIKPTDQSRFWNVISIRIKNYQFCWRGKSNWPNFQRIEEISTKQSLLVTNYRFFLNIQEPNIFHSVPANYLSTIPVQFLFLDVISNNLIRYIYYTSKKKMNHSLKEKEIPRRKFNFHWKFQIQ